MGQSNHIVPFSDNELPITVDDEAPLPATATPEEQAARKQRRQERAAERERERKQLEADLKAERERREALETRVARMGGATFNASQNHRQNQPDPYQQELDAVWAEQEQAFKACQAEIAAKTYTPERERHYQGVSRKLEERRTEIISRRVTDRSLREAEGVQRHAAGQQVWRQQYPEIYGNERAYAYAQGTMTRRLAAGERDSPELVHEVMRETRVALKLGGKTEPTDAERARLTGIPSSGGGGEEPRGIVPTRELRMIAESMYSDLPPEQAFQKWVDGPGRELRKQKIL